MPTGVNRDYTKVSDFYAHVAWVVSRIPFPVESPVYHSGPDRLDFYDRSWIISEL